MATSCSSRSAADDVPKMPLEILVAQTQGAIGYMIESTLDSELMRQGIATSKPLVSLISYVVVDENSQAFSKSHQAHRAGLH
ncbi:MAG: hypothetical protein MZV70_57225 [Desulfobacterales bacterium]|nr:hypothetical protein [Desulfobacterales bacterium]